MAAVRPSPAPPGRGSISEECPGYFPGVLTARGAEESRAGWPALQLESQPCLTCSTRQALGPLSPGVWPGSRSQEGGVRPGWSQAAEGSESWGGVGEDWAGRGLQGPRLCDRWPSSYEWVSPEAGRLPEQSGVSQAADGQTPQAMAATASAGQLSSAQPQVLGAGGLRVAQKCAFSKIRSFVCSPDF